MHINTYHDGTGNGFIRIGEGTAYRNHFIRYLGNGSYSIVVEGQHIAYAESFDHGMAIIDNLLGDAECLARGFGFDCGGGAAPRFHISRWN
jgi:hypothetical protein